MLIQVTPEQVESDWEIYKEALRRSLPLYVSGNDATMNDILKSILLEKSQLWVYFIETKMSSVLLTYQQEDLVIDRRILFIYAVYSIDEAERVMVDNTFEVLRKYARANGCSAIHAYTNVRSIINLVRSIGGKAELALIEIGVV